MSDFNLDFNPQTHAYRINGKLVPSVTQVLKVLEDYSHIPQGVLELKREFGTHVHTACSLYVRRMLDESSVHESIRPYLEGFKRFMKDTGVIILANELMVAHPEFGYAGTMDYDVLMQSQRGQIDLKTGEPPWTVPQQTAAYEIAYARTFGVKRAINRKRWALWLDPKFPLGYKLQVITGRTDFNLFLSALNVFQARAEHRVDIPETATV